MRIVVIGDPHAHPQYDNERFRWLGRYVCEVRPDVVVCMGDLGDFPSLCKHSKAKEKEGKRLREDRLALQDAIETFHGELDAYNAKRRAAKKGAYRPRLVITLGNHDARPVEYATENPEFEGYMDACMAPLHDHGWEVLDFKDPVEVGGFLFCHYFPSGTMGRPVGGANIAQSLLSKGYQSCVVGHDHRFRMASATRFDGTRLHAISAGCYVHDKYREGWCRQTEPMWDRGILRMDGVQNGDFAGYAWLTMAELKRRYG